VQRLLNLTLAGGLTAILLTLLLTTSLAAKLTPLTIDLGGIAAALGAAALSWRFDRSRAVYLLLLLLFAELADRTLPATLRPATALLTGFNLLLLALLVERGMHSLRGALLLSLPGLQAVLLSACSAGIAQHLPLMQQMQDRMLPSGGLPAGWLIGPLLPAVIALVIQIGRFWRYPTALEGALIWALAAATVAGGPLESSLITLLRGGAALALAIALIEYSYTLAYRDELTGLPGRRALNEACKRLGSHYCLAMVDIDFFKKLNDRHGHDVGDQVLRMVAARLRNCDGGGRAYRYGGEEFCIVFSGAELDTAQQHLEALREKIAGAPFVIRSKNRPSKKPKAAKPKKTENALKVTVSIGVAQRGDKHRHPDEVLKAADQALYRAKEGGRNQVCV